MLIRVIKAGPCCQWLSTAFNTATTAINKASTTPANSGHNESGSLAIQAAMGPRSDSRSTRSCHSCVSHLQCVWLPARRGTAGGEFRGAGTRAGLLLVLRQFLARHLPQHSGSMASGTNPPENLRKRRLIWSAQVCPLHESPLKARKLQKPQIALNSHLGNVISSVLQSK
jgi:hypothetical protein